MQTINRDFSVMKWLTILRIISFHGSEHYILLFFYMKWWEDLIHEKNKYVKKNIMQLENIRKPLIKKKYVIPFEQLERTYFFSLINVFIFF